MISADGMAQFGVPVRGRFLLVPVVVVALAGSVSAACSTSPAGGGAGSGDVLQVAASINAWGSILSQLGGARVHETSIITNPDTDPHDYEPTPDDAKVIARSHLFVENGIGYDTWASKTLAASPQASRKVIDVGNLVHVPDDGNPHRWYSPTDVTAVADAITEDLSELDPQHAAYFAARHHAFETRGLAGYNRLISGIRRTYAGTAIGASESIVAPLASALHLDLVTPASFLKDISEGTDPSPADLSTISRQIRDRKIKVYVYNSQNATPDVTAQVAAARAAGIPVATVTETLSPATATFQQWQSAQLRGLAAALREAGRR